MLSVSKLSAGYGAIPVLHQVSMTIAPGESLGILGHNGMGKTTLLRCLIGALKPTEGRVQLNDVDVTRMAPHGRARLGMAYVPQGREIFPALTARDNLRMGLVKTGNHSAAALDTLLADFPRLVPLLDRA
ncbi:MAG: ATP-binding cassette domain-containing protein, partial [Caldimonas sp.]